jgi:uncharacterized Zn finger protein (UPF0148 family)
MMKSKTPKPRPCPECGEPFVKLRMGQKSCTKPECAISAGRKIREKKEAKEKAAERKVTRERKLELKSRQDWLKEAQSALNAYVRWRDRDEPCISCGRPASWEGQWHASHFRSVGAASAVRFNLWNIHKACSICNHHLSGNIAAYEPRIVKKIGQGKVDWLKSQNQTVRYTPEYLSRLKKLFTKAVRIRKRA